MAHNEIIDFVPTQPSGSSLPAVKVYERDKDNKAVKNVGFVNASIDPLFGASIYSCLNLKDAFDLPLHVKTIKLDN